MLLLRSLNRGGAERQAAVLARSLAARGWDVALACFYGNGPLAADLDGSGVRLLDLRKRGRWDVFPFLLRLRKMLRQERPDILHGYLPVPNLLAALIRGRNPALPLVWGVRSSDMDLSRYERLARMTYWMERMLSRRVDLVISNTKAGAQLRIAQGFPSATMRVIPNGTDTERFRFDADGRARLREGWRIAEAEMLVGLIGRLDPMKGYPTFLTAAAQLVAADDRWRFVGIGQGPPEYTEALHRQARELGLEGRLIWGGARDDMAAVYSALDIVSSASSFGEGFSNVIAEAMACGVPCVVTDVGDSVLIVDDLGIVVPPGNSEALAAGIERLHRRLTVEREALREALRHRIEDCFSVSSLVERTASELQTLLEAQSGK
jgi:glycosyltransferase involved in cell wall biosynthesis